MLSFNWSLVKPSALIFPMIGNWIVPSLPTRYPSISLDDPPVRVTGKSLEALKIADACASRLLTVIFSRSFFLTIVSGTGVTVVIVLLSSVVKYVAGFVLTQPNNSTDDNTNPDK